MTMKGLKHTLETKQKMSLAKKNNLEGIKGFINSNRFKGKTHSKESKEKMSLVKRGIKKSEEHKKKISLTLSKKLIGRKLSKETRNKLSLGKRGNKSMWWKGGRVSLKKLIVHSWKYREWRDFVFKRDNYICQNCLKIGRELQAHHIITLSKILDKNDIKTIEQAECCEELWDINNGVTLCKECHKQTDSYGNNYNKSN